MLKPNDQNAVDEFHRKIKECLGEKIHSISLFGSKVRGTDGPYSDIDIFIVVKDCTAAIKDQIIDIAFDVNLKYDVYISPRVVPLTLFRNPSFQATPFVRHVEWEGLPL